MAKAADKHNRIMINLRKGNEPNALEILVDDVDLKPFAQMKSGIIDSGIILKFHRYDLENVLTQMVEDYGADELIKRIKGIE